MANKVVVLEAEVEEVTGMATKGLVEVGEDTPGEVEDAMKMISVEEGEKYYLYSCYYIQ